MQLLHIPQRCGRLNFAILARAVQQKGNHLLSPCLMTCLRRHVSLGPWVFTSARALRMHRVVRHGRRSAEASCCGWQCVLWLRSSTTVNKTVKPEVAEARSKTAKLKSSRLTKLSETHGVRRLFSHDNGKKNNASQS